MTTPSYAYMLVPCGPRRGIEQGVTHIVYLMVKEGDKMVVLPTPRDLCSELERASVRYTTFEQEGHLYVSVNVPHVGRWPEGQMPGGMLKSTGRAEVLRELSETLKM